MQTPATAALDAAGIDYRTTEYEPSGSEWGASMADALHLDPAQLFVASGQRSGSGIGLDTTPLAARAERRVRGAVDVEVAEFARKTVGAGIKHVPEHQARPDPGAERDHQEARVFAAMPVQALA